MSGIDVPIANELNDAECPAVNVALFGCVVNFTGATAVSNALFVDNVYVCPLYVCVISA